MAMSAVGSPQECAVDVLQERKYHADSINPDAPKCAKLPNQSNKIRTAECDDEDSFLDQEVDRRKRMKQARRQQAAEDAQRCGMGKEHRKSSSDRKSTPSFPLTEEDLIERGIRRLDEEYAVLNATEETLLSLYSHLRREEKLLREALQYASETPKERRARIIEQQRVQAEARLELALFNFDEEDISDGDNDSIREDNEGYPRETDVSPLSPSMGSRESG